VCGKCNCGIKRNFGQPIAIAEGRDISLNFTGGRKWPQEVLTEILNHLFCPDTPRKCFCERLKLIGKDPEKALRELGHGCGVKGKERHQYSRGDALLFWADTGWDR